MGLSRPPDPHGMTKPSAWPEADEDALESCRLAFDSISRTVASQLESALHEKTSLFDGVGVWTGGAAGVALTSLSLRIRLLANVAQQLTSAAEIFDTSKIEVEQTKQSIIELVEWANDFIERTKKGNGFDADTKKLLIDYIIWLVRTENLYLIDSAAARVLGESPVEPGGRARNEADILWFRQQSEGPIVLPASWQGNPPTDLPGDLNPPAAPSIESPLPSGRDNGPTELPPGARSTEPSDESPASTTPTDRGSGPSALQEAPTETPAPVPPVPTRGTPPHASLPPSRPTSPSASSSPGPLTSGPSLSPATSTPAASLPSTGSPGTTPATPSTTGPATPLTQAQEFQKSFLESSAKSAAQQPLTPPLPPTSPAGVPLSAQPPAPPPTTPNVAPVSPMQTATGPSTTAGPAPVVPPSTPGPAPSTPMPLGPAPTPPPAAPVAPTAAAPPLATVAGAASSGSVVGAPAPTPVPVSAARAHREAVAASLRRPGNDMTQIAQRIAAALNAGITDIGFYWLTGLTKDNSIVVANNYALGYIPENVHLPEQVKFATADESIPAGVRATWVTYPILALHGWCQHHGTELRAVIATEDQFKGFDPGTPKIILRPDDIPDNGNMEGRHRLQVIAPAAAAQLAAVPPAGLTELLPTRPADDTPPNDNRADLWFEVFRPLLSSDPGRAKAQLEAFATYAEHAQEIALHRAHTATEAADQRAAIADWIYWQHLAVLVSDATAANTAV